MQIRRVHISETETVLAARNAILRQLLGLSSVVSTLQRKKNSDRKGMREGKRTYFTLQEISVLPFH